MTFKPSKLPQFVVAYEAYFGKQVPIEALRILQPVDLVALIQKAIDTNTPLVETGWAPTEFGLRGGCIIDRARPSKGPDGERLH